MTTTTDKTPISMVHVEDAATSEWLDEALRHERERVHSGPSAAAIDRMRARIFTETETRKSTKLAA